MESNDKKISIKRRMKRKLKVRANGPSFRINLVPINECFILIPRFILYPSLKIDSPVSLSKTFFKLKFSHRGIGVLKKCLSPNLLEIKVF